MVPGGVALASVVSGGPALVFSMVLRSSAGLSGAWGVGAGLRYGYGSGAGLQRCLENRRYLHRAGATSADLQRGFSGRRCLGWGLRNQRRPQEYLGGWRCGWRRVGGRRRLRWCLGNQRWRSASARVLALSRAGHWGAALTFSGALGGSADIQWCLRGQHWLGRGFEDRR